MQQRRSRLRTAALIALACACPAALGAQSDLPAQSNLPRSSDVDAPAANALDAYSPAFVPPDHWSVAAARRLHALGLAPHGFDASDGAPSQRELARVFEHAVALAADGDRARLAEAYRDRFRAEFALETGAAGAPVWIAGSGIGAGYERHVGAVVTGWGYIDGYPVGTTWQGPEAAPDTAGALLTGSLQLGHRRLALRLAGAMHDGDEELYAAYLGAEVGPVAFWAGRRPAAFGPGASGPIVLRGVPVDGGGVQSARPFRLPWIFRHVGPVSLALALGRQDMPRSFDDVTFLFTRGAVAPHPRLALGLTRAAVFGGDGNTPVDAFAIFSVLIGKHAGEVSELDNQVVALDVDYRPPTERWLPLRLYLEWGFEDAAGAWRDVPAILAGVAVPTVPGAPLLSLAVERTSFAESCCGNPIWYRHSVFLDGWTRDGVPMGHPLAGHGEEWAAVVSADLVEARVRTELRGVLRERGDESLLAPEREGSSRGVEARLEVDVRDWLRITARGAHEDGEGWRESAISVGLRALF